MTRLENRNSKIACRLLVGPLGISRIWKFGKLQRGLRAEMYKLARLLPDFEKFGLASQLRRAATSVTANIAEGFGRFGYQENIQFCRQARGSVYELRDHLTTCADEGYVSLAEAQRLDTMAQRVTQMINGYLRSTIALKKTSQS